MVAASADGREIGLRLAEPDRSEFNTAKYPWLRTMSFSCTDLDPSFTRDPHLELPRVELGPAVFSVERARPRGHCGARPAPAHAALVRPRSLADTVDKCPAAASASCKAMEGVPGSSFVNASWDRITGVAKLRWAVASPSRAKIPLGTKLLMKHFGTPQRSQRPQRPLA